MSGTDGQMTRREREDLAKLVRRRERMAMTATTQRSAELLADPIAYQLAIGRTPTTEGVHIRIPRILTPDVPILVDVFVRFSDQEDRFIKQESDGLLRFSEEGLKTCRGYSLELFGVPVPPREATARGNDPRIWWLDPPLVASMLRLRVRDEDSPVFAEQLWIPGIERSSIHGLDEAHTSKQLTRADTGLALFTNRERLDQIRSAVSPGRTPDLSREELERGVVAVMAALWKRDKRKPSLADISAYLDTHTESFSPLHRPESRSAGALGKRITRAHLSLPELYRKAENEL